MESPPATTLAGEEEPPPFYCHICKVACASALNLQSHFLGARHRKAEEALKGNQEEDDGEDEGEQAEPPKPKESLEDQLNAIQDAEPALGLEYVYEFLGHNYCRYECKLCNCFLGRNQMFMHIVGARHRVYYLSKHHPSLGITQTTLLKGPKKLKRLRRMCVKIEEEFGRNKINVVEGEDKMFTCDVVSLPCVSYQPNTQLPTIDFTDDEFLMGTKKPEPKPPLPKERFVTFRQLKAEYEEHHKNKAMRKASYAAAISRRDQLAAGEPENQPTAGGEEKEQPAAQGQEVIQSACDGEEMDQLACEVEDMDQLACEGEEMDQPAGGEEEKGQLAGEEEKDQMAAEEEDDQMAAEPEEMDQPVTGLEEVDQSAGGGEEKDKPAAGVEKDQQTSEGQEKDQPATEGQETKENDINDESGDSDTDCSAAVAFPSSKEIFDFLEHFQVFELRHVNFLIKVSEKLGKALVFHKKETERKKTEAIIQAQELSNQFIETSLTNQDSLTDSQDQQGTALPPVVPGSAPHPTPAEEEKQTAIESSQDNGLSADQPVKEDPPQATEYKPSNKKLSFRIAGVPTEKNPLVSSELLSNMQQVFAVKSNPNRMARLEEGKDPEDPTSSPEPEFDSTQDVQEEDSSSPKVNDPETSEQPRQVSPTPPDRAGTEYTADPFPDESLVSDTSRPSYPHELLGDSVGTTQSSNVREPLKNVAPNTQERVRNPAAHVPPREPMRSSADPYFPLREDMRGSVNPRLPPHELMKSSAVTQYPTRESMRGYADRHYPTREPTKGSTDPHFTPRETMRGSTDPREPMRGSGDPNYLTREPMRGSGDPNYPPREPMRDSGGPNYPREPMRDSGGPNYPREPMRDSGGPNYPREPMRDSGGPNYPREPMRSSGDPNYPREPMRGSGDPNYPREPMRGSADPHFPPRGPMRGEPMRGSADPHYPPREPMRSSGDHHFPSHDPMKGSAAHNFPPHEPIRGSADPHFPPRQPMRGSTGPAFPRAPNPQGILRNPAGSAPTPDAYRQLGNPAGPPFRAPFAQPLNTGPRAPSAAFPVPKDAVTAKFFDSLKDMEISEVTATLNQITKTNPAFKGIHVPSLVGYLMDTGKLKRPANAPGKN